MNKQDTAASGLDFSCIRKRLGKHLSELAVFWQSFVFMYMYIGS